MTLPTHHHQPAAMSAHTDPRLRPSESSPRTSTMVVVDLAAAATSTTGTQVALKSVAVRLDANHPPAPAVAIQSNHASTRRAACLLTLLGLALLSLIYLPSTPRPLQTLLALPTPQGPASTYPTLPPPPPPYSCASAFLHASNPPCACTVACESSSNTPCCPDFARVSHAVTAHLVAAGIITGPIRRDLGNNMTAAWTVSQWRRTTRGQVLVVGQACVRSPAADTNKGGVKWECADQAHVVSVHAEVQPGWVDYVVSKSAPPKGKRMPAFLDVGFGSIRAPTLPSDLFYLRLTDAASIQAVVMSATARLHYCGLSVLLDTRGRNGRVPWDPTLGRDWHALSASTYLLTRGAASPIEYDASPRGVDVEYEKVARQSGGRVVPWMACYVRQIRVQGKGWVDVVDRATGRWVEMEDDGMWFDNVQE